ncbi:MAG: hypothetical protein R3E66_14635 [bacterium]
MQIIARDPHYQEVWRGVTSVDDAGEFDFELPIGPDTTPDLLMIELAQSHNFTAGSRIPTP